ncbi:MAG: type II toxin-antitoxin system VapC family toxin [Caulobacteraceae bacterium]
MTVVVDASVTIAIALREEVSPVLAQIGERIVGEGAVVPALWRFEVANVLLVAARRKRIARDRPAEILRDLEFLPILIDEAGAGRAWSTTLALAERHVLTVYDAAYLELALRIGAPLASRAGALIEAARQSAVETLG